MILPFVIGEISQVSPILYFSVSSAVHTVQLQTSLTTLLLLSVAQGSLWHLTRSSLNFTFCWGSWTTCWLLLFWTPDVLFGDHQLWTDLAFCISLRSLFFLSLNSHPPLWLSQPFFFFKFFGEDHNLFSVLPQVTVTLWFRFCALLILLGSALLNSNPSLFHSLLVFTQLKCQNLGNFKQANVYLTWNALLPWFLGCSYVSDQFGSMINSNLLTKNSMDVHLFLAYFQTSAYIASVFLSCPLLQDLYL